MFSILRANARLYPGRLFSSTPNTPPEMKDLVGMLVEAHVDKPSHSQRASTGDVVSGGTNRPVQEYKPIHAGSFIRPYDLSLAARSWAERPQIRSSRLPPSARDARARDPYHQLGIDPLKLALHPALLTSYMTDMAMIYPRSQTRLTMKSHRRITRAIKRAKMMGVIPLHSRPRGYF
ncbi:hypothetical protein DFH07DRAFT_955861 [Mycena maculata]|uniref:Small ribosomal subunit protein bS18m n=1 Tax=Mycena maculata TaxID=230809 RepID=A0AAD7NKN3_9AGAR|nr:hypothetical protein DFH07DRAFT_955861 [Mycena maculata]